MKRETENKTVILPQDLLIEILIRLPAKSLLSFKCVSKSWLSLISDHHFATLHFEMAAACTQTLILVSDDSHREVVSVDFNTQSLHDVSASAVMKLPLQAHQYVKLLGSCRGFILLDYCGGDHSYGLNLYVWNPVTSVHKQITSPPIYCEPYFEPYLYGFGYDSSTNDYLITIAIQSYDNLPHVATRMWLFSLRSNTWKEWEGTHLPYAGCYAGGHSEVRAGLFFNGGIHWFAYHCGRREKLILVFDLKERSFFEIALPYKWSNDYYCIRSTDELRAFGEFLTICAEESSHFTCYDIWIMKNYKVHSSWTKLLSIVVSPYKTLIPICCTKSGDIIASDYWDKLVKLNDKGEVQEYRSYNTYTAFRSYMVMHTASLLSLPGDT